MNSTGLLLETFNSTGLLLETFNSTGLLLETFSMNSTGLLLETFSMNSTGLLLETFSMNSTGLLLETFYSYSTLYSITDISDFSQLTLSELHLVLDINFILTIFFLQYIRISNCTCDEMFICTYTYIRKVEDKILKITLNSIYYSLYSWTAEETRAIKNVTGILMTRDLDL